MSVALSMGQRAAAMMHWRFSLLLDDDAAVLAHDLHVSLPQSQNSLIADQSPTQSRCSANVEVEVVDKANLPSHELWSWDLCSPSL